MTSLVHVSLSDLTCRGYDIFIDSYRILQFGEFLTQFEPYSSVVILTDDKVHEKYVSDIYELLRRSGFDVHLCVIDSGEKSKNIDVVIRIWNQLLENGTDRNSILAAVGGGVVGDIGGFVAATYARGIRFIQIPTTLLAQVDSSVGGKVGVDLSATKNMVGCFYQPVGVLVDTSVISTLPQAEYICGLGEVAKYAVSLDSELFEKLESNADKVNLRDSDMLKYIVKRCCEIKARIVGEDEFERVGSRIFLNYGHTFAHAFEVISEFTLSHGQAVAIGLVYAARLSARLGMVDKNFVERQIEFNRALGLPMELPQNLLSTIDWDNIISIMRHDKKTESGKLRFVLPTQIGQCVVVNDVDPKNIVDNV
ncbi:MAG: 3-dehydroquinate synthase [Planctomycetaceae bacterium]|jgi:3-dehydroquinate synthase|nr:3-dehydroquinate synthase [Planctomycetaceae bacterium]